MNSKPCLWIAGCVLLAASALASGPAVTPPASRNAPVPPPAFRAQGGPPAPTYVPPAQLNARPLSRQQRLDVQRGMVTPPLAERRALYVKDLGHGVRLNVVGAPVEPMMGETRTGKQQVRVPLIGLSW